MSDARDEFYVGYLPEAPAGLAAWTRARVRGLVLGALALGAALVATQAPFSTATFEFGTERTFEGVLVEHPVPALRVERPGDAAAGASRYLLVAFGKHGAREAVAGLDGQYVRLRGTLVHHEDRTMIELADDGIAVLDTGGAGGAVPAPHEVELGEQTLAGEIVDSKCFLGVMKPGNLKPHRACAVRCISGGVPPVLLVRDSEGNATYLVLVDEDGGALSAHVLDEVAEPVRVTGLVVRRDDLLFLHAAPGAIERVE